MANQAISIIDDDAAVRDSLALLLEAAGYTARLYDSGENFLAAPERRRTRCVILDLHLPGIDGLEVLRRYRSEPGPAPVIMISGMADDAQRGRAIADGALDLLRKPVALSRLLEMVLGSG